MQQAPCDSWLSLTCTVLGGFGFDFSPNETVDLKFKQESFELRSGELHHQEIYYLELEEVEIAGPGTVTKGGGFIGGGFGIDGAIQGIALAAILNALTTKSKVHTFLRLVTNSGEIHLHYGGMEPAALRIALSEVFVVLRRQDLGWLAARRALLDSKKDGMSKEQYELLVSRLLKPPTHRPLSERQGRCPSCDESIPLLSPTCPKCHAQFGAGTA